MNATRLRWLAVVTLLVPGFAWAQQAPGAASGSGPALPPGQRAPQPSTKMYEDIEIMRRLLESNLYGIYGIPHSSGWLFAETDYAAHVNAQYGLEPVTSYLDKGNNVYVPVTSYRRANWPHEWAHLTHSRDSHSGLLPPAAEGSYLPGYGIVYTMTLPPPGPQAKLESAKPPPKPLSAWERTRRELRGDKVEAEATVEHKPPSVSGTLLKLLADNGHNFAQLKDEEVISVAVTFRNQWRQWGNQCMACHNTPAGHGTGSMGADTGTSTTGAGLALTPGGSSGPGSIGSGGPGIVGSGGGGAAGITPRYPVVPAGGGAGAGAPPGYPGVAGGAGLGSTRGASRDDFWVKIEDRILLGDLHVKQGRHKEALEAYGKAAETLESLMNNSWQWDKDQVNAARELYGKMISAHLAAGDNEAAKKVMDRIDKIPAPRGSPLVEWAQKSATPKPAAGAQATLPGKMIVTATKRQLDQVGSGKMSFEDFKKAVTVQYLTFPTAEKRTGEVISGPDELVPMKRDKP